MSLTDPIADYDTARYLFVQGRALWVTASLMIVAALTSLLAVGSLRPEVRSAISWARWPVLCVAAFNASVLLAFFASNSPSDTARMVWEDLEWHALLFLMVVFTTYRATAFLFNGQQRWWAAAYIVACLCTVALVQLAWQAKFA